MSATITLHTERPEFEAIWRPALEQYGLIVRTAPPSTVPNGSAAGSVPILDGASEGIDEDELLTLVGLARAVGARPAVHLPTNGAMSSIDDVVDELCGGLVARNEADVARMAGSIARRTDRDRAQRFEFLTVSPRGNELLAILGDGRPQLLSRPLGETDDGSDVVSIALADNARSASIGLESGHRLDVEAARLSPSSGNGAANGGNTLAVDGTRLGARLRELRLAAGLTQAELARRTGIHRPNIARVEAGRHTPSLDTLARLASAIGVPTTRVLAED
ncbi:MAG: helix-turn-helix domain-containing protein [Myxococcota bacterium]